MHTSLISEPPFLPPHPDTETCVSPSGPSCNRRVGAFRFVAPMDMLQRSSETIEAPHRTINIDWL